MLTVSQLSKSFAGRALFDDVSLQVNRGDRIGLVGPNGAGKSTLFSLILGEVSPDNGSIAAIGLNLSPDPLTVRSSMFTFLPYGSDNYFSSDKKTSGMD
jgi:ABC-type multidrug transport system ATPase subunit